MMRCNKIRNRFAKLFGSFRRKLPILLLSPIMPLLGWGTLTHAYINSRIPHHLENSLNNTDNPTSALLKKPDNMRLFIDCAGYPDIIKAKGFLEEDTSYDYVHNPLPNRYYGQPEFATALYKKFRQQDNEQMMVFALSWRSHQISDIFAHHMPLKRCYGFANCANFFAPFWDEALEHIGNKDIGNLAASFYRADHWTTELIIDLYCYLKMDSECREMALKESPSLPVPYIRESSDDYLKKHLDELSLEYPEVMPVEMSDVKRGKEFNDTLNFTTRRYFDSLIKKRSAETILRIINEHNTFDNIEAMLENVAYASAKALIEPDKDWNAPTFNEKKFLNGGESFDEVFTGVVDESDYENYYSKNLEEEYKKYKPKREGIVKLVLEKIQFAPIRFIVAHTPLVTSGNFINRALLPRGKSSYSLSLRFAFNFRELNEDSFVEILRITLEEADVIKRK